jgi:subfamily B ATP-binding cassette protein MsbA
VQRVRERRGGKYASFEPIRGELGQKEALSRLWGYLTRVKGALLAGLFFTVIWSLINLGYGGMAKLFLEAIQRQVEHKTHDMKELNFLTAAGMFIFLIRGVTYFAYNYAWSYAGQQLSMRLRNTVFAHLQGLHNAFFDQRKTGQLMSAISNDIPAINNVLSAIQDTINAPIIVFGGAILLFWLNWALALISLVCLPPIALVILWATKRMRASTGRLQDSLATVSEHAEETLSGVRVVKSFGNEEYESERFSKRSQSVYRSILRTIRIRLIMTPMVELIGAIAIILVLWVGGYQIVHNPNGLTVGGLTWFVLVLKAVADGAKNLGNISVNLSAAAVAADRVFTLLGVKSDIQDKPDCIVLKDVRGRVVFDNVGFAYSPGIPVLEGISFVMEPGEVVAIVGPTGSGKTTIAGLIPRFYDVRSGRITIDGADVRDVQVKSLRAQIGIVPQDTVLFAGTLRENIAYGRLGASDEEIISAAKTANAWEFIERFPEGLDTIVGERGTRLSGGQRQRIAIARAVLRDPRILILDEATSSLDTQSEALVQEALQRLVADRTTLVIAHRLSTIRNADKILVIQDGHIVEEGNHSYLLARGGVYSRLYNTQFRRED